MTNASERAADGFAFGYAPAPVSSRAAHLLRSLICCAALLAAVAVVFAPTLSFGLVNWDDPLHLAGNPFLQPDQLDRFAHFWREPYAKLYIPVTYNVWAILYELGFRNGAFASAVPLRLANVALHGVNAVLVFAILRAMQRRHTSHANARAPSEHRAADEAHGLASAACIGAALLGAALFALHPLQVESVAWISEFRGLLSATFGLAALWLVAHGKTPHGFPLLVLALLCKPSAVALPFMAAVIAFCTRGGDSIDGELEARASRRSDATARVTHTMRVPLPLAPWFAVAIAYSIAMAFLIQPTRVDTGPIWLRPFVALDAVAFYLGKLIAPVGLSVDYSQTPMLASHSAWFWCAGLAPALLAIAAWRGRLLRAPLLLFIAALLPVLGLVPFEFQRISTVADRYAYLAMLGPALLMMLALDSSRALQAARAKARAPREEKAADGAPGFASGAWRVRASMAVAGVALLSCAVLSARQVQTWRDDVSLWSHALRVNPRGVIALCNVAEQRSLAGDKSAARDLFARAVEVDPSRAEPRIGLAKLARDAGRLDEAEKHYREAVDADPVDSIAATDLASLLAQAGRLDDAERAARVAIKRESESSAAWTNLASIEFQQKRAEAAMASVGNAIRHNPRNARAWLLLATLTNDEVAARRAMQLDPADAEPVRFLLARAIDAGRAIEARELEARLGRLGEPPK